MTRPTRIATAALLALGLATLPGVLDRCAESCEAQQDALSSTPTCHHAHSSTTRIGSVPTPCGHDHNGTLVTAATGARLANGSSGWLATAVEPSAPLPHNAPNRHVPTPAPPGLSLPLDTRSLPLRI